jgi:hypothetical protein
VGAGGGRREGLESREGAERLRYTDSKLLRGGRGWRADGLHRCAFYTERGGAVCLMLESHARHMCSPNISQRLSIISF